MPEEGIEPGISEAEVTALIAAHAALSTGIHGEVRKRKTADQIVTNSNVFQDDDELFFPIGANEVWEFTIEFIQKSSYIASFYWLVKIPDGAVGWGYHVSYDSSWGIQVWQNELASSCDDVGFAYDVLQIAYGVVVNGDTPGNIQFQWCQVVPEASDTIVRANSCIIAHRLA